MTDRSNPNEKDPLPTIFQLLVKQQRVSEQTNRLVESMVNDVSKAREQSEKIAILVNRVENLERSALEFDRRRTECVASVVEQFRDLEAKREQNKDRIAQLEQELTRQISSLKAEIGKEIQRSDEELRHGVEEAVRPIQKDVSDLREKIAYNGGKYGGIVALVISLIMMLIQWVISHPTHILKPGP